MKYLLPTLLAAALLWIAYIAWANRRKPPYAERDSGSGGSDSGGGDACSGFSSAGCSNNDGGCGGGDGGGGGD